MITTTFSGSKIGTLEAKDFENSQFKGTPFRDLVILAQSAGGKSVNLGAGDDRAETTNTLQNPAVINGQDGDDTFVIAQGSKAFVDGGADKDTLKINEDVSNLELSADGKTLSNESTGTRVEFQNIEKFIVLGNNGISVSLEGLRKLLRDN